VKLLRDIAANTCTILCTIHQPSSEVFFLFDIVIYMKDGRMFYQGPASNIIPFYAEKEKICPENYNPSDFVMNLCQSDSLEELEKMGLFMSIPEKFINGGVLSSKKYEESEKIEFSSESPFLKQVYYITARELINNFRDIPALIGRFGVTIVLNLVTGLIFLNVGAKSYDSSENFNSHIGAISMIVIFALFGSGQSVLLAFPFERPMILREYATGTYSVIAYFISKIFVEAPLTFLQIIVQFILVYFLCSLQGNFIILVLACWGLGMVSNSVAMAMGCLVPDVKDVTELAPLVFVPQILFAGFFIRTSQIPVFLRWAQYLCSMKYAMNLVLIDEFGKSSDKCTASSDAAANCEMIQSSNDINDKIYYVYILILFGLFVGFRVIGGVILAEKAKRFY
jgi:ABC-type multidrug transport system permease subunit